MELMVMVGLFFGGVLLMLLGIEFTPALICLGMVAILAAVGVGLFLGG